MAKSNAVPAPFAFESHAVRTIVENDEIWFTAKDVALALGYTETSIQSGALFNAIPDEWKGHKRIMTLGGKQELTCISEQGLYFFLGRSDKPKALPFQKWVYGEVLPSIRKTGSYTQTISTAQQGELATLIAERFPEGRNRPYAWSRFNNHFRLSSYKNLPASRFDEAVEYIKTMPLTKKAETKPGQRFILSVQHDGNMLCEPMNDSFYWELCKVIKAPDNYDLNDGTIRMIGEACLDALIYRAGSRGEARDRARAELQRRKAISSADSL